MEVKGEKPIKKDEVTSCVKVKIVVKNDIVSELEESIDLDIACKESGTKKYTPGHLKKESECKVVGEKAPLYAPGIDTHGCDTSACATHGV